MFWTRFNPFSNRVWNDLQQLQGEMFRWFDRPHWGVAAFPAVNVWEDGDSLHVEAELPGLQLEDLEIFVTGNNQLTIKGERKQQTPEKASEHRLEWHYGSFVRTLTLPFPVDDRKVNARLENGVLRIELPKHEAARPRRIPVKA
ncbi:MAG: Hsp20/alpha crystallin family protein [Gemmataceae bacterium]|nr:Hsp20/alpha crystallin family protein [Gemmataceae bacterium]MCI0737701.1 Hsp20/alpha crystallin family protein [Gemmataceae bacterium]